jgi:hypothetical protein
MSIDVRARARQASSWQLPVPNVARAVCLHKVQDSQALDAVAALRLPVCGIGGPAGRRPAFIRAHGHQTMGHVRYAHTWVTKADGL